MQTYNHCNHYGILIKAQLQNVGIRRKKIKNESHLKSEHPVVTANLTREG